MHDAEKKINREYHRIHPDCEPDGWVQLLNVDPQLMLAELREVADGAGEEAFAAAVESAVRRQYPGIDSG